MVRSAAKNFRDVLVVVDPADYDAVLAELERPGGPSLEFRFDLARKAFAHTAAYDTAIAATLAEFRASTGGRCVHAVDRAGGHAASADAEPPQDQGAPVRREPASAGGLVRGRAGFGLGAAQVLQGKELSFTNLLDLDSAARIALEFTEPAAAVIKHTNPCGAAIGVTIDEAYVRAREADSLAAFGGIIGLNRADRRRDGAGARVDLHRGRHRAGRRRKMRGRFSRRKPNMRVVVADLEAGGDPASRRDMRSILGAMLVQQRDEVGRGALAMEAETFAAAGLESRDEARADRDGVGRAAVRVARLRAREVERGDLHRCVPHARDRRRADEPRRCGAGGGDEGDQRGGKNPLAGSVAASDAFFPFRDGLDAIAKAGATAVVQPGGRCATAK